MKTEWERSPDRIDITFDAYLKLTGYSSVFQFYLEHRASTLFNQDPNRVIKLQHSLEVGHIGTVQISTAIISWNAVKLLVFNEIIDTVLLNKDIKTKQDVYDYIGDLNRNSYVFNRGMRETLSISTLEEGINNIHSGLFDVLTGPNRQF